MGERRTNNVYANDVLPASRAMMPATIAKGIAIYASPAIKMPITISGNTTTEQVNFMIPQVSLNPRITIFQTAQIRAIANINVNIRNSFPGSTLRRDYSHSLREFISPGYRQMICFISVLFIEYPLGMPY